MFFNRLMIPSLMSQSTSHPLIILIGDTPAAGHGSGLSVSDWGCESKRNMGCTSNVIMNITDFGISVISLCDDSVAHFPTCPGRKTPEVNRKVTADDFQVAYVASE